MRKFLEKNVCLCNRACRLFLLTITQKNWRAKPEDLLENNRNYSTGGHGFDVSYIRS
jgi:hypothetical protein